LASQFVSVPNPRVLSLCFVCFAFMDSFTNNMLLNATKQVKRSHRGRVRLVNKSFTFLFVLISVKGQWQELTLSDLYSKY